MKKHFEDVEKVEQVKILKEGTDTDKSEWFMDADYVEDRLC